MQVISKQGTRCPMEGKPRDYITDTEPQDVPESTYYLRLIDDGSLLRVMDEQPVKAGKAPKAL
ncbi:MAG: hypothetical protein A3J24_06430 [Deltaproteobacteria bacterium RIFCSPLOWO2_02_FULL_53_8]|nr:MAG: hypothetical protein A3J24_06430 [Deltaproteobacteria bacterium RIFCSPLOWO2_02_FULL_53_8]